LCNSVWIYAQEGLYGEETVNDTIQQPTYEIGNVELPDPEIIKESYTYDPLTDSYHFTKTFDGFNMNFPIVMSREEFEKLILRAEMKKYFQQKFNAVNGHLEDEEVQRDMLPRYYVNSKLFSGIFGSNTIDIKPSGSVEFDMGMRYTRQDNPMLSPRNRKTMTFDFDQRISMGLQGMVGTRLAVNANYDTQSTFDFQNIMKLEYTPDEDAIVQKVEVGNVSMPISGSLIQGAQSLFGVKTELKFGKTTITGVFSEQKSETNSIRAEGGGTLEDFELYALDYDEDRHFFLSQYFRNKYDEALKNYPYINSRARITRLEVWVTNKFSRINPTNNNARNIVAIQDLGEGRLMGREDFEIISNTDPGFIVNMQLDAPSDNKNNQYDPAKIGTNFLNESIRTSTSGSAGFNTKVQEGVDFIKQESARKLSSNEFTFHPQLGYISLQQRLSNDEVLAVAFQYTIGDKVYQVGEFGTDGGDVNGIDPNLGPGNENVQRSQALILKMLKSNLTMVEAPVWNLMMKNIYQIQGAMNITQDQFRFNILYTDPSPLNYISPAGGLPLPADVEKTPLLKVFHLDRLSYTNDPQEGGDGFFDFLPNGAMQNVFDPNNPNGTGGMNNSGGYGGQGGNYGNTGGYGGNNRNQQNNNNTFDGITIDALNGRIIFTTVEPFGEHLFNKLKANVGEDYKISGSYNENQKKYVFREMYRTLKSTAQRSQSNKNKFLLKGKYSSAMGEGIPIGAFNVAPGSVVVNAGGRILVEGVDYTVDYNRGRVMILDQALLASNTPIDISVENNTFFGQQTKRFFGVNVEHQFTNDFVVGATFLRLSEKPMTHKTGYGEEAVNNTIWGFNTQYSTEVPFLTRLVNKLPNIDTDVESRVSFRGEFAFLQPGSSKSDQMNGEATSYIDDFEGTQSRIDIRSPFAWSLASTPIGFYELNEIEKDSYDVVDDKPYSLEYGFRRGKLSWYTIDPTFYVGSRPSGIGDYDLSSNKTRRIFSEELYPTKDIAYGESRVVNTLDLTFYPKERGPYNFNPEYANTAVTKTPKQSWGGVMRALNTTNFEQSNIEFVEFWVMDPYVGKSNDVTSETNKGELRLNFGFISEDILRDGQKQYENGLPGTGSTVSTIETIWGKTPAAPSLIYAFDVSGENRSLQDVGLDGINDEEEKVKFPQFAHLDDPAGDNFIHYLDAEGGILERYRNYNGTERNTPVSGTRGGNNQPDTEDIDGDNTMNTINAYFEYKVKIEANPAVGENYITDIRDTSVQLADGSIAPVRWVQYKIPIDEKGKKVGPISDLRSVRFMRMYLTGFDNQITLRFGSLDLVRSDWRRYDGNLMDEDKPEPQGNNTGFDVTSVNIQENYDRKPIPYVIPPGVKREQYYVNNSLVDQDEQSLSLKVYPIDINKAPNGLAPGDSRGVFKSFNLDLRQFKKLRMFIHAEALENSSRRLRDDEMVAFLRFGSDFTDNFYQVEIPLKVTNFGERHEELVWPIENEMEVHLELLTKLKIMKMNEASNDAQNNKIFYKEEDELSDGTVSRPNKLRYGIKGNPNFGNVRMMMIGVRNDLDRVGGAEALAGEFWFDELRMSDMDNKGGWAATASVDANVADFANISATGFRSTIGFGGLEQGPNQRSREDFTSYNIVTNVNLGQLLPKKWGINLPFNYAIGEEFITPEYDPANPDIKLKTMKSVAASSAIAEEMEKRATDYTKRKSINFIGVNKQKNPEAKKRVYDIENITLSHSYNEVKHHDFEVESMIDQQTRTAVDYAYSFESKPVEPFKKMDFLKGKYWQLFRDFNFNYMPSNITFNSNIMRQYNKQQFRLIDVEGIGLDPLYRRNYFFNYNYGFNFDLTKSLRLTYTGGSSNIVRNYYDDQRNVIESNTIWDDYFNIGETNQFAQQVQLNYELPFSKIPFLAFVRSSYEYTGNFNWQRASDAYSTVDLEGITYNLGNTIQNSLTQRLNTSLNMETFYRYLGLVKKQKRSNTNTKKAAIVPGQKVAQTNNNKKEEKEGSALGDFMLGLLTSVKNIQVNYSENSGTMLPGYMPGLGFFGSSKPTLGFVFGSQADVRYEAAKMGYLTDFPEFNQAFTQVNNKTLNFAASVSLIPDLIIDLTGERVKSENFSEQYEVVDGMYHGLAPYNYGNYSISTILIGTAFSSSTLNSSAPFNQLKDNRLVIANRLAAGRGIDINNPNNLDKDGFPIGYGKGSQAVLLPSFLAAYTGTDAGKVSTGMFKNIPLPNWNLKYTGLMRIGWFKDKFKRFSIHHGYRAAYTLGSFSSNYEYYAKPNELNQYGNYPVETVVNTAILTEQFNPLVRFDFETKSSIKVLAEIRRDRTLALSFDNNLLTETTGQDFMLGLGYRIKDVGFTSMYANNGAGGRIVSDINIKADLTLSKRETIIRYLDYDNNQVGGGQDMWSLRITADYMLSKNLTAIFFYDHQFSKAVISTMYPITNIHTGITMRYNFGN
jgi:cell surface protein SprA